jgi:hypothetical protein
MIAGAQAHAGLLFEPYAGYAMGDYKTVSLTGTETNGSVDGFAFGGRAGWMFGNFFLGGEYQVVRAQLKLDGANESTNWSNQTIFGELGYELPLGLRIFAGMSVKPHESELATTPERTKYTGTAKKAGIGFRYRVPFALNAEYIMYDLDKAETGTTEVKTKDQYSKFNYNTVLLSLSFPFSL